MERAADTRPQTTPAPAAEPELTQTNSDTVAAEEALVDDDRDGRSGDEAPALDATSTRTRLGAIPSSYGAPGGTVSP